MKFIDLWRLLDCIHPLWINNGEDCEYFNNKLDRGVCGYADYIVEYVTQDGEGVLTVEVSEEKGGE